MKKVLYMHTGSGNHGCEAIIKTTAKLLNGPNNIVLWSLSKKEDIKYGVDKIVEEIIESEQIQKFSLSYFEALIKRVILKRKEANLDIFIKRLFKNNVAISVGGDNYCYKWSAEQGIRLDRIIRKYCNKSVLWGCSIDSAVITEEMKDDLKAFDLITAREGITYKCLKKINSNTVQIADSAFLLEKKIKELPANFKEKNTVGINISPMVMDFGKNSNIVLENYEKLIQFILEKTEMNICLIPHVIWTYTNDLIPLKKLFQKYENSGRVSLIQDGTCEELKGYISKCRFFVGARTHATIAAYSTYVPTLVVGYSVKSQGIAEDLFDSYENYVLPVQNIEKTEDLLNGFLWIIEHELEIKERLERVIPNYILRAEKAQEYLEKLLKV